MPSRPFPLKRLPGDWPGQTPGSPQPATVCAYDPSAAIWRQVRKPWRRQNVIPVRPNPENPYADKSADFTMTKKSVTHHSPNRRCANPDAIKHTATTTNSITEIAMNRILVERGRLANSCSNLTASPRSTSSRWFPKNRATIPRRIVHGFTAFNVWRPAKISKHESILMIAKPCTSVTPPTPFQTLMLAGQAEPNTR